MRIEEITCRIEEITCIFIWCAYVTQFEYILYRNKFDMSNSRVPWELELELLELTIFSLELAKLESETTNFKIIEEMQLRLEIEVDLDASKVR